MFAFLLSLKTNQKPEIKILMGVNGILDGLNKLLKFKYINIILSPITIKINAMLIGLSNVLHRLEKRIAINIHLLSII